VEILQFKSATRDRFGRQAAIRTYPSFSPTGALDKIYFRGPLRLTGARSCRLGVSRVASDHLPIIADFEIG
jgi:endonuclease/exonuclease/phosphatase family metal-dependent hydrolase